MKILMINHFPLAGSGSGTYTKNLAVHLAALGHDVTVVLPENTDRYERIKGVKLHPVFFTPADPDAHAAAPDYPAFAAGASGAADGTSEDAAALPGGSMEDPLPFNFPCFTTHPRSKTSFADLTELDLNLYKAAFRRAIGEEVREKPDVIHGQHVFLLPSLAVGLGVPIVLTAHGTDLMGYDKWPEFREDAERVLEASGSVISISKDNLALLNERFPGQSGKFVLMRNGYDPGVFYPEDVDRESLLSGYGVDKEEYEGKRIVLFAGKLARFKGVDILLNAVKLYESGVPETLTLIVGDGEERDALKKQAAELGLTSVRFTGSVDQNTLRKFYNIADVSVVPSRREPFGLVAIEAMACGIPVIASDQGGLPDFVNDSVGALVRPEDPEDLADLILETLRREDALGSDFVSWRRKIAEYARGNYAQDKIMAELVDLYEKARTGR